VTAPPLKPGKNATPQDLASWQVCRKAQSSRRIPAGHANAEHKQWRTLQRYTGRREYYDEPTWPSPASSPTGQPAA